MQEIGNDMRMNADRLTIRVGQNTLAFAYTQKGDAGKLMFVPYIINAGISMAANLREALRNGTPDGRIWTKVLVLLDSPTVMVPIDEYAEHNKETLYRYSMTEQENNAVLATILPTVNSVALYSLNKDLRLVLTDNFNDIKIRPVCASVWQYLQRRSVQGNTDKLYCYFHDCKVDIFCYRKNRFRFTNAFPATSTDDVAYYIMAVWQQLSMDARKDEIYIIGQYKEKEALTENIRRFVTEIYKVNPSAEFNRHPLSQQEGIPFDVLTTLLGLLDMETIGRRKTTLQIKQSDENNNREI